MPMRHEVQADSALDRVTELPGYSALVARTGRSAAVDEPIALRRQRPAARYLVIGDTALARRICGRLARWSGEVTHLQQPDDDELFHAMSASPRTVAIAIHDDVAALRYALAIAHLRPDTHVVVTIFDRTISARLTELLPRATVTSPADVAAPVLADACLGPSSGGAGPRRRARGRRLLSRIGDGALPGLRTHTSHTQLLLVGLLGLGVVLTADWLWLVLLRHEPATAALLDAARVLATVGPGPEQVTTAYAAFSAVAMISTLVWTAIFTAGLVERLLEPGLLGIYGRRKAPRSGHVIVVGMGQVGTRLCAELRRRGIPVIGVERDPAAPQLRLARASKIPVVVGHGIDREHLERLRLSRSRAVAAVGSNELDNIAVAVAASAVSAATPVVLRAGEQEAIAETRSLLPLGATRDVLALTADFMVEVMQRGTCEPAGLPPARAGREAGDRGRHECGHLALVASVR
jgi:hypothetical protein